MLISVELFQRRIIFFFLKFYQQEDKFYFQGLIIPRLKLRNLVIEEMNKELGHFGERKILQEVNCTIF